MTSYYDILLLFLRRAVKAGLMPFGDGPDLFPSNMKLVGKDWLYFCTPVSVEIVTSLDVGVCVYIYIYIYIYQGQNIWVLSLG